MISAEKHKILSRVLVMGNSAECKADSRGLKSDKNILSRSSSRRRRLRSRGSHGHPYLHGMVFEMTGLFSVKRDLGDASVQSKREVQ